MYPPALWYAQMLFLESEDPGKDISLYINSPGGSVTAGMAIYDTMNYIKCDVSTICIGMAASMGAFLAGRRCTKGKRFALAKCRDHDPSAASAEHRDRPPRFRSQPKHILRTKEEAEQVFWQSAPASHWM